MQDTTSYVRVTQYFKRLPGRDPVTKEPVTYKVYLDWGLGVPDEGDEGYRFYGSPYQFFTATGQGGIYGDPIADTRVLIEEEEMPLSSLSSAWGYGADTVHFKHPNI